MPQTTAERQRAFRQRQLDRIAELEAQAVILRARAESAESALAAASEEIERLAGMTCQHPAAAVDGGRCAACGHDVW